MSHVLVHDEATFSLEDLVFLVAPATARTTLEIVVERDASLVLKAPAGSTLDCVERFIRSKRSWVYRKLAEKDALVGPTIVKQFVDGEGFAYLGRSHRLFLDDSVSSARLDRGRFLAPSRPGQEGAKLMRDWYVQAGSKWLSRRVLPWVSRLGVSPVAVGVRDLGFRWGSARPRDGAQQINIHWATLQLPPSLIDYVLVHELAHLAEANHTPAFWAIVSRLMPSYELEKTMLASVGRGVWLGQVSGGHAVEHASTNGNGMGV